MWLAYIDKEHLGKPAERVKAEDHQMKYGICPQCEKLVRSTYKNKVWQWVHYRRYADKSKKVIIGNGACVSGTNKK